MYENSADANARSSGFLQYCDQTTLHGLPYLPSEGPLFKKVVWVVVFGCSNILALYFTWRNFAEYISSTTTTSINTTTASLSELLFPTVTICNVNQVSRAFLATIDAGAIKDQRVFYDEFIEGNIPLWNNFRKTGNKSENFYQGNLKKVQSKMKLLEQTYGSEGVQGFTKLASQNCSDMMLYVQYKTIYSRIFYDSDIATTDYGICCTIYPYLNFEYGATRNLTAGKMKAVNFHNKARGIKNGLQNGLKLILDIESFDYAYFYRGSKGVRAVLSDRRYKPVVNQDGFYIAPGKEVLLALVPEILNTTEAALSRFTPPVRNCYTEEEFYFSHMAYSSGYTYSMKNCLYESVLDKIIGICKCKPTFVNFKLWGHPNLTTCRGLYLGCMQYWMSNFGSEGDPELTYAYDANGQLKKCYQSCVHQTDNFLSTSTAYPNKRLLEFRQDFCLILIKMYRVCQNSYRRLQLEQYYERRGGFRTDICSYVVLQVTTYRLCNDSNPHSPPAATTPKDLNRIVEDYARQNIAVVNFYIKDPYYTNYKKDQAMSMISFVGNAGGLVGLCMGFSFVSFFEILYHAFGYAVKAVQSLSDESAKKK